MFSCVTLVDMHIITNWNGIVLTPRPRVKWGKINLKNTKRSASNRITGIAFKISRVTFYTTFSL